MEMLRLDERKGPSSGRAEDQGESPPSYPSISWKGLPVREPRAADRRSWCDVEAQYLTSFCETVNYCHLMG